MTEFIFQFSLWLTYHLYPMGLSQKAILRFIISPNISARGTLKISPMTLFDKWGKPNPRKISFLVMAMSQLMAELRNVLGL